MKFKIEGYKNIYEPIEIDLSENKIYCITGENGVGKTNILRSISYFTNGKSENEKITDIKSQVEISTNCNGCHNKKDISIKYMDKLNEEDIHKIKSLVEFIGIKNILKNVNFTKYKVIKINNSELNDIYDKEGILNNILFELINKVIKNNNFKPYKVKEFFKKDNSMNILLVEKYFTDNYLNYEKIIDFKEKFEYKNIDSINLIDIKYLIDNFFLSKKDLIKQDVLTSEEYPLDSVDDENDEDDINVLKNTFIKNTKEINEVKLREFKNNIDEKLLFIFKLYIVINKIEEILSSKPISFFSVNASDENKLNYEYNLNQMYSDKFLKWFLETFCSKRILLKSYMDLIKSSQNSKEISKLKERIELNINGNLSEEFKSFQLYSYPQVVIENSTLRIKLDNSNEYHIGDKFETYNNSDGYKSFIMIVLYLKHNEYISNIKKNQKIIILFDEPDKNLHISLQYQLRDYLNEFKLKNPNISIVITNHSPILMSKDFIKVNLVKDKYGSACISNSEDVNSILLDILNSSIENSPTFQKIRKNNFCLVDNEWEKNKDIVKQKLKLNNPNIDFSSLEKRIISESDLYAFIIDKELRNKLINIANKNPIISPLDLLKNKPSVINNNLYLSLNITNNNISIDNINSGNDTKIKMNGGKYND